MQVDINLLPQKKSAVNQSQKIVILIFSLFLLCAAGLSTLNVIFSKEVTQLENDLRKFEAKNNALQTQISKSNDNTGSISNEVKGLTSTRVETVKVIEDVLKPLQQGEFINVSYTQDGNLNLLAHFERLEDVADYQRQLVKLDGMQNIQLLKLVQQGSEGGSQQPEGGSQQPEGSDQKQVTSKMKYVADFNVQYQPSIYHYQGGTQE